MSEKVDVRKHPRNLKSGKRTEVRRHNRARYKPYQDRKTKQLDPNMTKSFEQLAKNGKREYGTGLDLDKGENKRFIEKTDEIHRGKTSAGGRASTTTPQGTDVTIHTHPKSNSAIDKWNRPSGNDIYNMMFRTLNSGDLDEAYVIGPDRTWYRYYVDVKDLNEDQELWYRLRAVKKSKFDRDIETKYWSMYHLEKRIAHLDSANRKKFLISSDMDRRSILNTTKNEKRSQMKKYREEDKRDRIAARRAFNRFQEWIHTEWKVRIEKVPKNKDKSISMSYIGDN